MKLLQFIFSINLGFASLNAQRCLEPIPPPLWQNLIGHGIGKLIGNWRASAWMLATPAFDGEYAVAIFQRSKVHEELGYTVVFARAISSILSPPPPPSLPGFTEQPHPVAAPRIIKLKRHLPFGLANKVLRAWKLGMLSTKYPNDNGATSGCDGISYYFYADNLYFAQTWSPQGGMSKAMADLGLALVKFVKTPNSISVVENACDAVVSESRISTK